MTQDIRSAIARSRDTLLADALGAVALLVILIGGLSLPSLF